MKNIELKIFDHIHEDYVPSVKSTNFQDMPESLWLGCAQDWNTCF